VALEEVVLVFHPLLLLEVLETHHQQVHLREIMGVLVALILMLVVEVVEVLALLEQRVRLLVVQGRLERLLAFQEVL
jgi:hypothetical protein